MAIVRRAGLVALGTIAVMAGVMLAIAVAAALGVVAPIETAAGDPPNFLSPFLRQNGRSADDLCVWLVGQGGCWP